MGEICNQVETARSRQRARFAGLNNGVMTNADMRIAEVRQFCELDDAGREHSSYVESQILPHQSSYFEKQKWGEVFCPFPAPILGEG